MPAMLGPHPGVRVQIRRCRKPSRLGTWLVYQKNPVHGWEDQLAIVSTQAEAKAMAKRWNERIVANERTR